MLIVGQLVASCGGLRLVGAVHRSHTSMRWGPSDHDNLAPGALAGPRKTMTLLDNGWTAEQAKGLLDSLNLDGGVPDWDHQYLQKLKDWCSGQEKDWSKIESQ